MNKFLFIMLAWKIMKDLHSPAGDSDHQPDLEMGPGTLHLWVAFHYGSNKIHLNFIQAMN